MKYHFFNRAKDKNGPAGITVSKRDSLPSGDFQITEYVWKNVWENVTLWFVDQDKFTADEREEAKAQHIQSVVLMDLGGKQIE